MVDDYVLLYCVDVYILGNHQTTFVTSTFVVIMVLSKWALLVIPYDHVGIITL